MISSREFFTLFHLPALLFFRSKRDSSLARERCEKSYIRKHACEKRVECDDTKIFSFQPQQVALLLLLLGGHVCIGFIRMEREFPCGHPFKALHPTYSLSLPPLSNRGLRRFVSYFHFADSAGAMHEADIYTTTNAIVASSDQVLGCLIYKNVYRLSSCHLRVSKPMYTHPLANTATTNSVFPLLLCISF